MDDIAMDQNVDTTNINFRKNLLIKQMAGAALAVIVSMMMDAFNAEGEEQDQILIAGMMKLVALLLIMVAIKNSCQPANIENIQIIEGDVIDV